MVCGIFLYGNCETALEKMTERNWPYQERPAKRWRFSGRLQRVVAYEIRTIGDSSQEIKRYWYTFFRKDISMCCRATIGL